MTESGEQEDFYYTEPLEGGGNIHILKLRGHQVILMHRRNIYTPYNETPMKGPFNMNAKTAKFVFKTAASIAISALMGYTYKTGKIIEQKIDDHYADPQADTDQSD